MGWTGAFGEFSPQSLLTPPPRERGNPNPGLRTGVVFARGEFEGDFSFLIQDEKRREGAAGAGHEFRHQAALFFAEQPGRLLARDGLLEDLLAHLEGAAPCLSLRILADVIGGALKD